MTNVTESIDVQALLSPSTTSGRSSRRSPSSWGGVESTTQVDDTHVHSITSIGGATREFDTKITARGTATGGWRPDVPHA